MRDAAVIAGYLYRGEHYCAGCIAEAVTKAIRSMMWLHDSDDLMHRLLVHLEIAGLEYAADLAEHELDVLAGLLKLDRANESFFSSDDFPHRVLSSALDPPYPLCETCQEPLR